MKKIKYSEKDMAALISEVEAQFNSYLAKSETQTEDLKKSETAEVVEKTQETTEKDTLNYDENDIKEMNEMYASMTKSEAEVHFESLKSILNKGEETIAKSEKTEKDEEKELLKSEVESLKSEKEKLEKSFKDLTAKLVEFVKGSKAPKQKAITKLEYVAKSEEENKTETKKEDLSKLDKSEISRRLTAQIRTGKLEKSEREKINNYYQSGSTNIESIRHLLTGGN